MVFWECIEPWMQRYDVNDDVRTISLHFEKKNLPFIRGQLAQKNEKRKDIGRYSFFHFFCLLQTLFFKKKGKLKVNHILIYYFFSFIENTNRKVSNSKSYWVYSILFKIIFNLVLVFNYLSYTIETI